MFFFSNFFWETIASLKKASYQCWWVLLALYPKAKNVFRSIVILYAIAFFLLLGQKKNRFIRLSFIDSFFTLNVNFELRYCNFGVQHSLENLVYDFVSTKLFSSGYKHVSSTYWAISPPPPRGGGGGLLNWSLNWNR